MKKRSTYILLVSVIMFMGAVRASAGDLTDQTLSSDTSKGWRHLFNGKDLTGWKHVGPGNMTVEEGIIQTHGGMGLLYWTGETFGNCTIRVVFRMRDENSNAGFFIRIP